MYLDIDGVLVVWDAAGNCIELSRGFGRLMRFCQLHTIQPYWLSMWALQPETTLGLNCLLWPKVCPTMAQPIPLSFDPARGKSSVIDFASDFVWIEDGLGAEDLAVLAAHGAEDRYFATDGLDAGCLLKFIEFTKRKLGLPEVESWGPAWDSPFTRPRPRATARISPT